MPDRPLHPGETIRELVIKEHGLEVSETADLLNYARASLLRVLNGNAALSADMAERIRKEFVLIF